MQTHLITNLGGGAGRSLSAGLLALGLQAGDRRPVLVQQEHRQLLSSIEQIEDWPVPLLHIPMARDVAGAGEDSPGGFRINIGADGPDPFLDAMRLELKRHATGNPAPSDVVIDLPPLAASVTVDLLRTASSVLIPMRASMLEIEWAVRTATRLATIQSLAGTRVPVRFIAIVPDEARAAQIDRLREVIGGYDPVGEIWDPDALNAGRVPLIPAPYLDAEALADLYRGPVFFDRLDVLEGCRRFAATVLERIVAQAALLDDGKGESA